MPSQIVPTDEETQSVARPYSVSSDISRDGWDFYWAQVSKTLKDVFGVHDGEHKVQTLRSRVETLPDTDIQPAIYHLDPFQVAADIARVEKVTSEQKEKYGALLRDRSSTHSPYDFNLLNEVTFDQMTLEVPDDPRPKGRSPS